MVVTKFKLISLVFLCIFILSFVYAQSDPLALSKNKNSFSLGENILIHAEVYNFFDYPVNVRLETLMENVDDTYPLAVIPSEFSLESKETRKILIYDILVHEGMPPSQYFINSRLLLNNEVIKNNKLEFIVENTLDEFLFDIAFEKKVFVQSEDITLDYSSDVSELDVSATLTYPDGKSEGVNLPKTIKAEQVGTYELEVSASKGGYKTIEISEQFAVIGEHAEIGGVVEEGDNATERKKDGERNILLLVIFLGIILLVLLVILMGYLILRNKR